ncbi:MAG TPA: C-terminal helicase domain-containing protein, partial [Syntrophobacteraceae bacterium]|nr:C-terminal helicase domain-containing protein [Syntrophobacteraceae bacterium]
IEQRMLIADGLGHKNRLLRHLCSDKELKKAIVFSATKRDAECLARELRTEGFEAAALHGDMTQAARNHTMENMRRGKIRILVATDVVARGIDIAGISHVINFDLPRSAEDYVNRIGRTGRASESGIAISLVSRSDFPYLDRIERYIGQSLAVHTVSGLEPSHPISAGKSKTAASTGGRPQCRRKRGRPPRSRFKSYSRNSDTRDQKA